MTSCQSQYVIVSMGAEYRIYSLSTLRLSSGSERRGRLEAFTFLSCGKIIPPIQFKVASNKRNTTNLSESVTHSGITHLLPEWKDEKYFSFYFVHLTALRVVTSPSPCGSFTWFPSLGSVKWVVLGGLFGIFIWATFSLVQINFSFLIPDQQLLN